MTRDISRPKRIFAQKKSPVCRFQTTGDFFTSFEYPAAAGPPGAAVEPQLHGIGPVTDSLRDPHGIRPVTDRLGDHTHRVGPVTDCLRDPHRIRPVTNAEHRADGVCHRSCGNHGWRRGGECKSAGQGHCCSNLLQHNFSSMRVGFVTEIARSLLTFIVKCFPQRLSSLRRKTVQRRASRRNLWGTDSEKSSVPNGSIEG